MEVNGYQVAHHDDDGPRFAQDIWTKGEYDLGLQSDYILDIGAHIGLYSLYVYKRARWIWAIEPAPDNFSDLLENIKVNKLERITPVRCALWDSTGVKYLHKSDTSGGHRIGEAPVGDTVDTLTLADFVKKYKIPRVDIIKCDIEGAESHVFMHPDSKEIVKNVRSAVFEHANVDVISLFKDLGFDVETTERRITVCRKQ